MPSDFMLRYPPVIRFAPGSRVEAGHVLRRSGDGTCPRTFAVCSKTIREIGTLDEMVVQGEIDLCGVFDEVPHDPPLECVDALIGRLRETSAQAVLAVGGGSVLDAAKTAATIAPRGERVRPYFEGSEAIPCPGLPVVALPTTAGTGAEMTQNAVLSDHERGGVKKSLRSPFMVPSGAIVDPELTLSMPPELTAHCGMDALTQAIESYLSRAANTVTQMLAAEATRLLLGNLRDTCRNGHYMALRSRVAEGSLLSAMAFSQSGLGAVHGLAHPIGHALKLAHGLTCAILLPHILEFNASACGEHLERLAAATGTGGTPGFLEAVHGLCAGLEIPENFAAYGLKDVDPDSILVHCRSGSMKTNPRLMTDEDILSLLKRLS
ncbi:MAG: iron-containing alcohol dehydrogenase [Lentisphaeria bacterium]|nr:iron-containing alcohol dehydrogenase [Lentisphaeria bacterium]